MLLYNFRRSFLQEIYCWLVERISTYKDTFDSVEGHVRQILDLYPAYSQCILILAMAIERWILVCKPNTDYLSQPGPRRYLFYFCFSLLALAFPTARFFETLFFPTQLERVRFVNSMVSLLITKIVSLLIFVEKIIANEFSMAEFSIGSSGCLKKFLGW